MPAVSSLRVDAFFDPATSTVSYLVADMKTGRCALVDSVLDYDAKAGRIGTVNADKLIARVRELGAHVEWLLETHVHADHLSAAHYLREKLGGRIAIGSRVTLVQESFGELFNVGPDFRRDGSQFDHLFADGEAFRIGSLACRALHTPGHTPCCASYVVADGEDIAVFVGDTLFMPDYGTARCDFPGGDARTLYRSISRLLSLPAHARLYTCHDYQPGGRELRYVSTVAEQRAHNVHVHAGIGEDEFAAMRSARDATLPMPALILPAVQVNMRAGSLPPSEGNGIRYLKIPLDAI